MRPLARFGLAVATLVVADGCIVNHDQLAEHGPDARPRATETDGGKARPPAMDAAREAARQDAVAPPSQRDAVALPEGTRSITFVHGVTDSPWVAFCLSVVHDGVTTERADPFPAGGLVYGHSVRVADGKIGDLANDGLRATVVLAASPSAVAGMDCAAIRTLAASLAATKVPDASDVPDASGTGGGSDASTHMDGSTDAAPASLHDASVPVAAVRVASLPLVPAGALAVARPYLLVVGGCAGGRGVSDPSEQSVCGEGYAWNSPTLAEYVVAPVATAPEGHVGLTVLGGTPALTQLDLAFVPGVGGDAVTVATRVGPGALRPLSSYSGASASLVAPAGSAARLELFAFGSGTPIYDEPWTPTLAAGGLDGLSDGSAYTLIVVGPFPGFAKRRWWNDPLVTIVGER